jgi:hypothetical protein
MTRQYGFTERFELSGSQPKRDVQRPDEKPPAPSLPPGLVFKPDVRQAVRVARVRTYTLMAAAVLMVVALVLIISYRPPSVKPPDLETPKRASLPIEAVSPAGRQAVSQPPAELHTAGGVAVARSAVAVLDTLMSAAAEKWLRATELSPQGTVTRDDAHEAAEKLRKAVVLADSARRDVSLGRQQAELVRKVSREVESGAGFRLSVLYSSMDRYLKSMEGDAADRRAFYVKSVASVEAVLLDDLAESETQQNVAMSYLRHSEDRQSSLRRLAEQMREALRNVDNAGR